MPPWILLDLGAFSSPAVIEVQSDSLTRYEASMLTGGGPTRPNTVLRPQHQGTRVALGTLPESQNTSPRMSSWMRLLGTDTFELAGMGVQSVLTMPLAFSRCDCYGKSRGWRRELSLSGLV